jgi:hypothetical protein
MHVDKDIEILAKRRSLVTLSKSTLIRCTFYAVLLGVAFISNDPTRTIRLSRSHNIYIPLGAVVFLLGGAIITLVGFKELRSMPKVLILAGPLFTAYVLVQTCVRLIIGDTYSVSDMFYTLIELVNINLSILVGYSYVSSLYAKGVFALRPICYLILGVMSLYYIAIVASQVLEPALESITGMGITIDDLRQGVDRSIGFRRLYGPLGHSTSLGVVLIPVCGYTLYLLKIKPRPTHLFAFTLSTFLIIATGSRVAVFGYVALLIFSLLSWHSHLAVLILPMIVVFLLLLYGRVTGFLPAKLNPLNLSYYVDHRRLLALYTCCNAWLSTPGSLFFGVGYNELVLITKKWFLSAAGLMSHQEIVTRYGWLPGGPHSIFNWTVSGTGLIGLLLRCSFIYYFVSSVIWRTGRVLRRRESVVTISVLISCLNLFTDGSHVTYPMLMACWFVFYTFACWLLWDKISPLQTRLVGSSTGLSHRAA